MPPQLLALSPGNLKQPADARFLWALEAAAQAGLRGLLLREPELSDQDFLHLGRSIVAMHSELWLGVHDRLHLASLLRADGAHLGFRSLPPEVAARHFGSRFRIGLSTHAGDEPEGWHAADYVFHGPIFASVSHPEDSPGHRAPIGIHGLQQAVRSSPRPVWALGGVEPEHVRSCLAAGASGVAVLSGILGSRDPAASTALYLKSF